MGVVSLAAFKTEPGGLAQHLASAMEAQEHLRRLGLRAMTLQPIAGSDAGSIATVINYDDNADYASAIQKVQADEAWQEFFAGAMATGAATQIESSLMQDLDPNFVASADRPLGVILAIQWRARPGRMEDFIGNVMEAVPHIERMGGAVRVMQSMMGLHPMTTMVSTSFSDLGAYGAYSDAIGGDAEWQAFWQRVMSDPTADVVRSGLYLNISD